MTYSLYLQIGGGIENDINIVAKGLAQRGYRVRVVQFVKTVDWIDDGIEYYTVTQQKEGELTPQKQVEMYGRFLLNHGLPNVIIAVFPWLAQVARYTLTALSSGDGGSSDTKVVSWIHTTFEDLKKNGVGGLECVASSDGAFVINERTKKIIHSVLPDMYVEMLGNPVEIDGVEPIKRWNASSHRLLFVGRLEAQKRVDIIIEALALTKSRWSLTVNGDGALGESLKALAAERGVDNLITWNGWVSKPWDMDYEDITALVMSSDFEGFSLTSAEALARGIPVISTPVDGIIEVIKPGVNGYLYELGSSRGLAEVLDALDDGLLPYIEPQNCVNSIKKYEKEAYLDHFAEAVENVLEKEAAH